MILPLLHAVGLRKSFGMVDALRHAECSIHAGEAVALLGDNGAGKSTFVRLLSGVWKPDAGSLYFDGSPVDFTRYSVRMARSMGIETVHQDRCICGQQSIWRNIFTGRHLRTRWGFIDVRAEREATTRILRQWMGLTGSGLNPDAPAGCLSGGERQALALARALYFGSRFVILDEPTTALSLKEIRRVLRFIRHLKEEGRAVLLVSHNIQQAYEVADRFIFMDRGLTVGEVSRDETTPDDLAHHLLELAHCEEEDGTAGTPGSACGSTEAANTGTIPETRSSIREPRP